MNRCTLIGACLLTASLAVAASASEPAGETAGVDAEASVAAESTQASAIQALTVTRDPATGELGQPGHGSVELVTVADGVSGEMHRLLAEKLASLETTYGLSMESRAVERTDGLEQIRLGLENLSFAVVRVNADGELTQDCAEGTRAAGETLGHPPAATDAREDR